MIFPDLRINTPQDQQSIGNSILSKLLCLNKLECCSRTQHIQHSAGGIRSVMHIRNIEGEKETPLGKGRNMGLLDRLLALQSRNSSPWIPLMIARCSLSLWNCAEMQGAACNASGVLQSADQAWISWATPRVVVKSPGLSTWLCRFVQSGTCFVGVIARCWLSLRDYAEMHEAACNASGVLQSSVQAWISWTTPCVVVQSPGLSTWLDCRFV